MRRGRKATDQRVLMAVGVAEEAAGQALARRPARDRVDAGRITRAGRHGGGPGAARLRGQEGGSVADLAEAFVTAMPEQKPSVMVARSTGTETRGTAAAIGYCAIRLEPVAVKHRGRPKRNLAHKILKLRVILGRF